MSRTFAVVSSVVLFVACTDVSSPTTDMSSAIRAALAASDSASSAPPAQRVTHVLKPGQYLRMMANGHLANVDASGHVITDFGPAANFRKPAANFMKAAANFMKPAANLTGKASTSDPMGGWSAFTYWGAPSGQYVTLDSAWWVVPAAPSIQGDTELISLWTGLADVFSNNVAQSVLGWGSTAGGGGKYWSMTCQYVVMGSLVNYYSPIEVAAGDTIFARVTASPKGNGWHYTCYLLEKPDNDSISYVLADSVPYEMDSVVEVLEAWGPGFTNLSSCWEYPYSIGMAYQGIDIQTSSATPGTISWADSSFANDCGEYDSIANSSNPGGQVNVFFRSPVDLYPPPWVALSQPTFFVEVAGDFSWGMYPEASTPPQTYQWSYYGGGSLGTGQMETLYVDSSFTLKGVISTVGNVKEMGTLFVNWDPIASTSLGQMDDGEEPCIWIGAPLAPDGYDPGGAPPYTYQWSSSDGALSQTDTTDDTQDTAYFYDYNDDPPNGPSSVTVYLTVSDTGTQASASQYESSYDCPNDQRPKVLPKKQANNTTQPGSTPAPAALKPRSPE